MFLLILFFLQFYCVPQEYCKVQVEDFLGKYLSLLLPGQCIVGLPYTTSSLEMSCTQAQVIDPRWNRFTWGSSFSEAQALEILAFQRSTLDTILNICQTQAFVSFSLTLRLSNKPVFLQEQKCTDGKRTASRLWIPLFSLNLS